MKIVKILLVLAVVAGLGVLAWSYLGPTVQEDDIDDIKGKDVYVIEIDKLIDSLGKMPESDFCVDFYDKINDKINYYTEHNRFDRKNKEHNNDIGRRKQLKLINAYSDLFIRQSYYVFNGDEWNTKKINSINTMTKNMRAMFENNKKWPELEKDSEIHTRLKGISTILGVYYTASGFYSKCSNFKYTEYELDSLYPVEKAKTMLNRAANYVTNGFNNEYVDKCTRLKTQMTKVPRLLFNAHYNYYRNKIDTLCVKYTKYDGFRSYVDNLYNILYNDQFPDDRIYNVSGCTFLPLKRLLEEYNNKAFEIYGQEDSDILDEDSSDETEDIIITSDPDDDPEEPDWN